MYMLSTKQFRNVSNFYGGTNIFVSTVWISTKGILIKNSTVYSPHQNIQLTTWIDFKNILLLQVVKLQSVGTANKKLVRSMGLKKFGR